MLAAQLEARQPAPSPDPAELNSAPPPRPEADEGVDLDAERGRISLSTKALEPEPGDMLTDPQKVFEKAEEMAARYKQMLLEQAEDGEDPIGSMMV